jgi:hypothetical protein
VTIKTAASTLTRRHLQSAAGTKVDMDVTAIVSRLAYADPYAALSSQLQSAASSGALVASLKTRSPLFSDTSAATVSIGQAQRLEISNPTGAPTAAPTVPIVLPVVTAIATTPVTGGLTIVTTITKLRTVAGDSSGGTVYCMAADNSTAAKPASASVIKQLGAIATYPATASYPLTLSFAVTDLRASQLYAVYCYVESSLGVGSTLSQVTGTAVVARTACCKGVTFATDTSNVNPTSVVGFVNDPTKKPESLFFQVDDTPDVALTVTVVVTSAAGTAAASAALVTPVPRTFTFKPHAVTVAQRQGRFFLSAAHAEVVGDFVISLVLSGESVAEYLTTATAAPVKVLDASSPVPAPVLLSAAFSSNGQSMTINFDSATDQANITAATWYCDALFAFRSDSATQCSWTNSSSVSVVFGAVRKGADAVAIAYLDVGDTVAVKGALVGPACDPLAPDCRATSLKTTPATVTALAPTHPTPPTLTLITPSLQSSCANLTLDGTGSYGSGGRPWTQVLWTVQSDFPVTDTARLQTHLNTFSRQYQVSHAPSLPSAWLAQTTYTISLSLTNFLGQVGVKSVVVVISADTNLPQLSILGPSYVTLQRAQTLSVKSLASFSPCADKAAAAHLSYSWSVQVDHSASLLPFVYVLPYANSPPTHPSYHI